MLKIISGYPPNISTILQYFTPPEDVIFCYGQTLYNPTGKDIPEDVYIHECEHQRQMEGWLPDSWWMKYCLDSEFRKQQEVAAYSAQYLWVKDKVPNKVAKLCLHDLATNLQKWYNLGISYSQAET